MKHLLRTAIALLIVFCLCAGCSAPSQQTETVQPSETTAPAESVSTVTEAPPLDTDLSEETDISSSEDVEKAKGGKPWLNPQVRENITEGMELSPKDNFYLYVNYDFQLAMKNGEKKQSTAQMIADEMLEILNRYRIHFEPYALLPEVRGAAFAPLYRELDQLGYRLLPAESPRRDFFFRAFRYLLRRLRGRKGAE